MNIPYVHSDNDGQQSLTVFLNGVPKDISNTHINFFEILSGLKDRTLTIDEIIELIDEELYVQNKMARYGDVEIVGGEVFFKGVVVETYLTNMMIKMLNRGTNIEPWCRFLTKLMKNPAKHAVQELFQWLEKAKMPITDNGNFLAYKKVMDDYSSSHRNADGTTFWNKIGTTIKMPRNQVDDNRHQTCSTGLHFCSYDYLPQYMGYSGKVLIMEINPRHVVSIPSDYDFAKGRGAKMNIIGELTLEEAEHAFPDQLVATKDESWFMNVKDCWEDEEISEAEADGHCDGAYDREQSNMYDDGECAQYDSDAEREAYEMGYEAGYGI